MRFPGRPVKNANEMSFDFDGDDYLDPVEEEELMRSLVDDEDENDDFDEDDWDSDDDFEDDDF